MRRRLGYRPLEDDVQRIKTWMTTASAGAGPAPNDAQYVVLAVHADLLNERVLTAGNSITITDGGVGLAVTVALATPGTCTVATTNVATAPHTHAVTSSSSPGATASILASAADGGLQLIRFGIGTDPDTDNAIKLVTATWVGLGAAAGRIVFADLATDQVQLAAADLYLPTGLGIIHADGVTAGMVLRADGTRFVPSAATGTVPFAPTARGDMIAANATPAWARLAFPGAAGYALVTTATDPTWDQTPNWSGLHTFDGGWILGAAQTADLNGVADALVLDADADTTISAPTDDQIDIEISNADDFTFTANSFNLLAGSSVLLVDTCTVDLNGATDALVLDADADTTISAPTDDQIDIEISNADDFTFTANTFNVLAGSSILLVNTAYVDLNGAGDALVLDADADTTISAPTDDQIDIEISNADDFTFTANALNVLVGSNIVMGDGCAIGQAAGPLVTFDDTGNSLELTGGELHVYDNDMVVYSDAGVSETMRLNHENDLSVGPDIQFQGGGALAATTSLIFLIDSDNSGTGDLFIVGKDAATDTYTELLRVTEAPIVFVNDTANALMTIGITVNQGANDNEIFAGKSSDVGHPFTTYAEADTFCSIRKSEADAGGLYLMGLKDAGGAAGYAVLVDGYLAENTDTTKSAAGIGCIVLRGFETDGATARQALVADGNIVVVQDGTATRFILDKEGEMHSDAIIGVGDDWDGYDDLVLAADLSRMMKAQWDEIIRYRAEDFERAGLITLSVDEQGRQHAFIRHKAFLQFYACVFRDVLARLQRLEQVALAEVA